MTRFRVGFIIAALAASATVSSFAQTVSGQAPPDSLVRMLASPDWRIRGEAGARLNLLPVDQLSGSNAAAVIPLFEREAHRVSRIVDRTLEVLDAALSGV